MPAYRLETETISARYDFNDKVLYVVYRGIMTPDVTTTFYAWAIELVKSDPTVLHTVYGSVYDFREVKQFTASNIGTAMQQSQQANIQMDISHVPIALLTETPLQTEWVRLTNQLMPGQERKRLVKSIEEAHAFFEEFHAKRAQEAADSGKNKPGNG
jgi:hypothetical protein